MIRRALAHSCLAAVIGLSMTDFALAGIWYTDPVLGAAAEYSSNPELSEGDHTAESHGAVLLDAPTTYRADNVSFSLQPSFRIANSTGYSSLASDYAHLTAAGELDMDRDTFTLTGRLARDSSLYSTDSLNGSIGVRRDTTLTDAAWTRALTERLAFSLDVNSSRLVYGSSSTFTTLTDYRYSSAAPSLSWQASERTTLIATASVGLYDSSGGLAKSSNSNLEVGFTRQLSPLWTVTAEAGYSRESDKIDEEVPQYEVYNGNLYEVLTLETFKSTTNGTVFSANVVRQGERLQVSFGASRSVVPIGLAYLSQQESYQASFSYPYTERWTFGGMIGRVRSSEPQIQGPTFDQTTLNVSLSAAWQVTEKWTLTLRASEISSKYAYTPPPTSIDVAATGFTVLLSRRFDRVTWH